MDGERIGGEGKVRIIEFADQENGEKRFLDSKFLLSQKEIRT
jgi:hypothetical protein